jgi:predicted dienelactone hydrolase
MQAVSYRQRMPVLLLHAALLSTALLAHELTAAEPPQRTSSHTPDEPVAGLRSLRLSYKTSADEPVERTGMVWYPAAEPMQQHNYGGQIGFVASDSKVLRGKHPLLLFSHGFWGSADQSIFLTEELARRGYIVAAVNHADSLRSKRGDRPVGWTPCH